MVGNTNGVPPDINTPFLTPSTILSKFTCPGIISFWEVTTPINGLFISSSIKPDALNNDLWGAFVTPFLTTSLLTYIHLIYIRNLIKFYLQQENPFL